MVAPVSSFDWHEGSGSSTASILAGGYSLNVTDWVDHDGQGAVGPNASVADWSLAVGVTVTALSESAMMIGNNLSQYYNLNASGRVGIYPNYSSSGPMIPTNVPCLVVFTVAGGTALNAYIDGVLAGTWSGSYSLNPANQFTVMRDSKPAGQAHTLRYWDVALTPAEVAALSAPPSVSAPAALTGTGALQAAALAQTPGAPAAVTAAFAGAGKLSGSAHSTTAPTVTPVPVAPSARDFTRTYMLAQLGARGKTAPWSSSIPAQRPARFFTIEELNSATEYGAAADSQLLQIRGYDSDRKPLGDVMRLIKALWAAMPGDVDADGKLYVQSVEHAGGPSYDEDPDVAGLYYGQLIAWVTVMTKYEIL